MQVYSATDIDRDPRTPIPPCVMASSAMELQLEVFEFCDHTCRSKRKQNASMIFAHCATFHTCLFPHSDCSTYAPEESQLF